MNHKCRWWHKVLCFFGLHRWDEPGGVCECCGAWDDFFDRPDGGLP